MIELNPICAAMGWTVPDYRRHERLELVWRGRQVGYLSPADPDRREYEGVYRGTPGADPCFSITRPDLPADKVRRRLAQKLDMPVDRLDEIVVGVYVRG